MFFVYICQIFIDPISAAEEAGQTAESPAER
jgi:hypothetical protein